MPRVDVIDLFEKRKVYRSFIKNPEGKHLLHLVKINIFIKNYFKI